MSASNSGSGSSAEVVRQAEEACSTMQAALAVFKDSRDASCPLPSRQQVHAAVHLLRMETAKVGLLYNEGEAPSDTEATALLKGFQQAACALCMLYTGVAAAGAGSPTLRQSLNQTATSVIEACVSLVRGAMVGGARGPQLMMLSGFCLEMLDAAGRAPLDSRTAIGRAITMVLKQVADALKELDEAVQRAQEQAAEAAAANGSGADGNEAEAQGEDAEEEKDEDEDGSEFGFGFEDAEFTPRQLAVARGARAMLAAVIGLCKVVVRLLLAERDGLEGEAVEGWESMLYHIRTLGPLCDDLAASVYPPQNTDELASSMEGLANSCELLADECPMPGAAAAAAGADAGSAAAGGECSDAAAQQEQAESQARAALQAALQEAQAAHGSLMELLAAADGDGDDSAA